jgi:hypothetical protein
MPHKWNRLALAALLLAAAPSLPAQTAQPAQPAIDPALAPFNLSQVNQPNFNLVTLADVLREPKAFVQYLQAKLAFRTTFSLFSRPSRTAAWTNRQAVPPDSPVPPAPPKRPALPV